jgi:hypothetical protein
MYEIVVVLCLMQHSLGGDNQVCHERILFTRIQSGHDCAIYLENRVRVGSAAYAYCRYVPSK